MYSLLIADDEKWIKQRLAETIDWKQLNINSIYTASNGEEALSIIIAKQPDIILSDIKMPVYSGIQLMEEAVSRAISSKFILISGFAEFSFAQDALRLGAIEYLMKPVKDMAVVEAVEKCIAILEKEHRQTAYLTNYLDSLTEKLYRNLVLGKYKNQTELQNACELMDVCPDSSYYGCMVIKYTKNFQSNLENIMSLTSIIQKELSNLSVDIPATKGYFLDSFENHFVCIFQTNLEKEEIGPAIEKLCEAIERSSSAFYKYGLATGFGRFYDNLLDLNKSYSEAHTALRYHIYTNNTCVHRIDDLITSEYELKTCYPDNLDLAALHIKNGEIPKALSLIKNYIYSIPGGYTPADLQLIAIYYSNEMIRQLLALGFSPDRLSFIPILLLDHLQLIYHPEDAYKMLESMINSILPNTAGESSEYAFTVQNILIYIKKNYHLPITSKSVAEEFHYNPSYFSKLFSEEIGQPFTKYLAELRVKKAKELLKKPQMRISEVAKEVGFDDYQYFIRTFKQYTNLSPSAYRDSIR